LVNVVASLLDVQRTKSLTELKSFTNNYDFV